MKMKWYSETMWIGVFDMEDSSVYSHDMIDNRESDAHTFTFTSSSSIHTVEFLFYVRYIFIRYSNTIIRKYQDTLWVSFFVLTCQDSIFPWIFDKVWKYIVDNLAEHIFIHAYHCITWHIDFDWLIIPLTLRNIFLYEGSKWLAYTKSFNSNSFLHWMRGSFKLHNLFCRWSKSIQLSLKECECLGIEFHCPVFDCFEVALYRGYWCAYLMREISEKVRTYFLLYGEWLVEVIDRRYERKKLILFGIS